MVEIPAVIGSVSNCCLSVTANDMLETMVLSVVVVQAVPTAIGKMEPVDAFDFVVDVDVAVFVIGVVRILPGVFVFVDFECFVRCLQRK